MEKKLASAQPTNPDNIECPLCHGTGELTRAEMLDRLGVKDFARVAQLSAEEAFRLLHAQYRQDGEALWNRFECELTKRTAQIDQRHNHELRTLTARTKELETAARNAEQQKAQEVQHANRRVEDSLREVAELQERNHELELEMSKIARRGKLEEVSFEDEAQTWPGMCVSEKLAKNGDYILAFRDPSGAQLAPRMLVDNKDKSAITESDIKKVIRDAKERHAAVGVIVAKEEAQLRQTDRECRWAQEDGIWVLRTTRGWLRRDLDVLRPLLDRMRTEGADFLQRNAALAEEVRRTLVDLDEVEKELKKAAKSIESATALTSKYRSRLQVLCDGTTSQKKSPDRQQIGNGSKTTTA